MMAARVTTADEAMERIRREPQTIRSLAGGSLNHEIRRPIRAIVDELLATGAIRVVSLNSGKHFVPVGWTMPRSMLRAYILDRCVVGCSGCHEWRDHLDSGQAFIVIDGKRVNVRRALVESYGIKLKQSQTIRMKCENTRCVARGHMSVEFTSQALVGRPQSPSVRHKISETRRRRSSLSWGLVREVRAATNLSERQAAERFGIARSTIGAIRRHRIWPELGVFGQLLKRAA